MAEFETYFLSGARSLQPAASAADQKFYQVEDEGNIIEHSDGSTWEQWGPNATIVVVKAADQSVTSSTTLVDDDDLAFPIKASEVWAAEFNLFYNGAIGGDLKVAFTVPAGATGNWSITGPAVAQSSGVLENTMQNGAKLDTFGTAIAVGASGTGQATELAVIKVLVVNSTTAGAVTLQWAQNASDGDPTTIKKNSYLVARK